LGVKTTADCSAHIFPQPTTAFGDEFDLCQCLKLGAKLPLRICLETLNTKPSEKMPLKMFGFFKSKITI
jgi:hypothetical protein